MDRIRKQDSGGRVTMIRSNALRAPVAIVVVAAAALVGSSAFASTKGAKVVKSHVTIKGLVIGQILLSGGLYQTYQEADVIKSATALGMTVKSCNADDTPTGQQNCVDEMISSKVAGVIFQPSSDSSATAQIKAMQA